MSGHIDRILGVIDAGLQSSAEASYGDDWEVGVCWRCQNARTSQPDELCGDCRTTLSHDLYERPLGPTLNDLGPLHHGPRYPLPIPIAPDYSERGHDRPYRVFSVPNDMLLLPERAAVVRQLVDAHVAAFRELGYAATVTVAALGDPWRLNDTLILIEAQSRDPDPEPWPVENPYLSVPPPDRDHLDVFHQLYMQRPPRTRARMGSRTAPPRRHPSETQRTPTVRVVGIPPNDL